MECWLTIVGKVAPVSGCVRGSTGLESQPFVNEVWKGCFELSAGLFLVGYRHGRLGLRIKRFDDIICLMWDLDRLSREGRAGGDRDRVSLHALLASARMSCASCLCSDQCLGFCCGATSDLHGIRLPADEANKLPELQENHCGIVQRGTPLQYSAAYVPGGKDIWSPTLVVRPVTRIRTFS